MNNNILWACVSLFKYPCARPSSASCDQLKRGIKPEVKNNGSGLQGHMQAADGPE